MKSNFCQFYEKIIYEQTKEDMEEFFKQRTDNHIQSVQKYGQKIYESDPERFNGLLKQLEIHDASKYEEPEYTPYLYITWDYKCKDEGIDSGIPEDIKDRMNEASQHHVLNNSHHPEYYNPKEQELINREDRDAPPEEIIEVSQMPEIDIAEMVADWVAMGEKKGNSAKEWADKNIGIRWNFTPEQIDLIYKLIDIAEN